jgi:hypothetical protein
MRRTIIFLSEYLFEVDNTFNTFFPGIALESEERRAFHHWWKLKEITGNDELNTTRKLLEQRSM